MPEGPAVSSARFYRENTVRIERVTALADLEAGLVKFPCTGFHAVAPNLLALPVSFYRGERDSKYICPVLESFRGRFWGKVVCLR